jgi:hypothetical protein
MLQGSYVGREYSKVPVTWISLTGMKSQTGRRNQARYEDSQKSMGFDEDNSLLPQREDSP